MLLELGALLAVAGLLAAAEVQAAAPFARAQVSAAPSAGYSLIRYSVAGGGGVSSGGGYTLTGTAGQADAGRLSGGRYTVGGGFWASLGQVLQQLFLPLARR
jgi:hypothetical protein